MSRLPPERASEPTGSQLLSGAIPLIGTPSASKAMPSAWNPGPLPSKPRSISASTLDPAHSAGTFPEIRNQVVDQGAPHGAPGSIGTYAPASPSCTATWLPAGKYRHLTGFAARPHARPEPHFQGGPHPGLGLGLTIVHQGPPSALGGASKGELAPQEPGRHDPEP